MSVIGFVIRDKKTDRYWSERGGLFIGLKVELPTIYSNLAEAERIKSLIAPGNDLQTVPYVNGPLLRPEPDPIRCEEWIDEIQLIKDSIQLLIGGIDPNDVVNQTSACYDQLPSQYANAVRSLKGAKNMLQAALRNLGEES